MNKLRNSDTTSDSSPSVADEKEPEKRPASSENRRLIMTRVRTRRHLSRLLLLFSSSGALQTRHCLTLLLLGLTSLRTVLPYDEKTRPQSRDPSALPRHIEVRRYSRRDLDALGAIPEWMRAENEASGMTGQSANDDVARGYRRVSDSLKDERSRDGLGQVTGRTHISDGSFVSGAGDRDAGDRARHSATAINYPGRELDGLSDDPAEDRRVADAINLKNMRQSEAGARDWLGHLVRKRGDASVLQTTLYHSEKQAASEIQFQDNRDYDNGTSLAIPNGPAGQSASDSAGSAVHEHDAGAALIKAPLDHPNQSRLRESSNISQPRGLTGSGRDHRDEAGPPGAGDALDETLVNSANERVSNYSAYRSSRGNEASSGTSGRDIDAAAARHRDDSPGNRSDGKTVGFEATRQTHLDARNIYPLDNRSGSARGGSGGTADYLGESNNFDVANESANSLSGPYVDIIAVDTLLGDDFDDDGATPVEGRVELDENSPIGNGSSGYADDFSDILSETGTRTVAAACDESVCRESDDNDIRVVRAKKFGRAEESSGERAGGNFARVNDVSTIPANDSDTDIDVDSEAPFTGFEGSQKFPVKVNQKTSATAAQVEKFDRRHFGPHKEDVLEETSTWYPSTVAPDLPKSPSRDVLHRHRKTNAAYDDVTETSEGGNSGDGTIDSGEKRNDTHEGSSWLPGASSGRRGSPSLPAASPDEKLATTTGMADGDLEGATRGGRMDIGVAVSSAKSIDKINITILGLFEMTHGSVARPEGSSELQAAKLAVDHVNQLDVSKYFRLRLICNDTKVS